jgi:hypothetical protein
MAYKIFISYSIKDLPIVNHVTRLLANASILFILFWSRHPRSSEWVLQEVGIATHAKKTIMPVVLESGLNLPGFLQRLKYLPAYNNPERALSWLRANVFERAQKKQQTDGLVWLGLGAAIIWLLNRNDDDEGEA